MRLRLVIVSFASLVLVGCGGASPPAKAPDPPPRAVPTQIISPTTAGTAKELMERGEKALLAQKWREAADAFETLLAGDPNGPYAEDALFGLGTAYEGLEMREKAKSAYEELARRFPEGTHARAALVRQAAVVAYLEDWPTLGKIGDAILARRDADDVDRMTGLGARGLAKIEAGDDAGAMHEVQNGLDIADALKYGMQGRLPVAAAQLRFA